LGSIVEPLPRQAVTYTHLGFAQYVAAHGQPLPPIDARANWPGTFALIAFVEAICGHNVGFTIGRWAPLVFELLWIPPLLMLGDIIARDHRVKWLGVWIFLLANWTEEEYLSPQALDFTFYLVIVATLLAAFAVKRHRSSRLTSDTRGSPSPGSFRRWSSVVLLHARGETLSEPETPWTSRLSDTQRIALMVMMVSIAAIATLSHQLTPYMLILESAVFVLANRVRLRTFPWIVAVMAISWTSLGAASFWSHHLSVLFGSAGDVSTNFASGVTSRIQGSLGHRLVLASRILIVILVIGAALISWCRDRLRGLNRPWLLLALGAPVLLIAAQDYGGEGVIRTYLFILPLGSVLAASLLYAPRAVTDAMRTASTGPGKPCKGAEGRTLDRRVTGRLVGMGRQFRDRHRLALLGLAVSTLIVFELSSAVAGYGDDQVEQVSPVELTALTWFYSHVPTGSTVFTVCINLPWRYQGTAAYKYGSIPGADYRSPTKLLQALTPTQAGSYLITTANQAVCGTELEGLPDGWLGILRRNVQGTGDERVLYASQGAQIARIEPR
jgi:hypothetical protein